MSADSATSKLKELIERRGEIAHRVEASSPVYKKDVVAYKGIVFRLAVITHNRTVAHVYTRTSKRPWRTYRHGKPDNLAFGCSDPPKRQIRIGGHLNRGVRFQRIRNVAQ